MIITKPGLFFHQLLTFVLNSQIFRIQ